MTDGSLSFFKSWEGFLPPNTVVMARRGPVEARSVPNPVRFGFEALGLDLPAARDLFLKITAALGLGEADYALDPAVSASVRVRFVVPEQSRPEETGWNGALLTTYCLEAMLKRPELKKIVWTQLKSTPAEPTPGVT